MEMTLNTGAFEVLNRQELFIVGGGSKETAGAVMIIGGAVIAGILAPVTCGGSVAVYAQCAAIGYGLMATGVATTVWG